MRTLLGIFAATAFAVGLSLTAAADSTAPDSGKKVEKAKGKPGAPCKTNADCDQTQNSQTCQNAKCQAFQPTPPT